ncbi:MULTISPECIES: aldehyde dehydrogenase [Heyndrickxia]|uniref:aldehyde dehydrogenase n=1 Tax=Heyndrickxia TaxID=2837504 RepID=UPI002DB65620|nr:aldehyde dehydrogenase [Weizmannia sp. CD-2023]MEC2305802.1 aldehyde dehydrogenase [Weizmannia sp. CD-2023]MEC2341675.1 aldehyde dehydrogenase [Weizmannia sp. CD-2023]
MNAESILAKQQAFFYSGKTRPYAFRIRALEALKKAVIRHERALSDALRKDLNKSAFDAYATEIGILLSELSFTLKHLKRWMKPERAKTPLTHVGSKSMIIPEPYGTALIISPWNFPLQLALVPLVGAVAAGNCAVIKPSEYTPHTSEALKKLVEEIFPEDFVAVIEGGVETSQVLLELPFDKIFFTGSVPVGKIVMEAAARRLTPLTLELGGKSPCIVHEDAKIKLAAKRIAWGKFLNAGQTCIAPDYVYVHQNIKTAFFKELEGAVHELYGEQPLENPDYTRIVSDKHFSRLRGFLEEGKTVFGGRFNEKERIIEPTVLTGITWENKVMQEEIFGPVLPVLEYENLDEVIAAVRRYEKPLALYLFSGDRAVQQRILNELSFGGGSINDTVYHFTSPYLPFGGVGASGMGAYHGKESFNAFSHRKSVLRQTTVFDIPFRYPNMKNGLTKIKRFLK